MDKDDNVFVAVTDRLAVIGIAPTPPMLNPPTTFVAPVTVKLLPTIEPDTVNPVGLKLICTA